MNKELNAQIPPDAQTLEIKRLIYRSGHRGCKETDLILGIFAQKHLYSLPSDELAAYARLLEEDDVYIWAWLVGSEEVPGDYKALVAQMQECRVGE